jgi:hypothetical protein
LLAGAAVIIAVFQGWPPLAAELRSALDELPQKDLRRSAARVLLGFTGMGCVLLLFARCSQAVAWQVAVSVTIAAAAIDWQRNLLPRGNIDLPALYRQLFVFGVAGASVAFVHAWRWQRKPRLADLWLFATCVLMGIGYLKGLGMSDLWASSPFAEGRAAYLWGKFRSEVVVHLIFTALLALSLWAGVRERRKLHAQEEADPDFTSSGRAQ